MYGVQQHRKIGFRFRSGSPHQTVTQMHFNYFVPSEFSICLNPFSLILLNWEPWIFSFACISLFQTDTDKINKYDRHFPILFLFLFEINNIHHTHVRYSLKLKRERVNKYEWKYCNPLVLTPNSLWKFLAHYHNKNCQRPIRDIRSICPN